MPYTDEHKTETVAVYATEGLAAAARHTDACKATILNWANQAHVNPPERSKAKTKAATEARTAQLNDRKLELAEGLMDDIAQLRARMFAPCQERKIVTIGGSKDDRGFWTVGEVNRDEPTFVEQKSLMTTIAIAVDKVQVLTGGATQRTEHRYESGVDAEIRDLSAALASNDG